MDTERDAIRVGMDTERDAIRVGLDTERDAIRVGMDTEILLEKAWPLRKMPMVKGNASQNVPLCAMLKESFQTRL